jgi:dihydrofolate reductase
MAAKARAGATPRKIIVYIATSADGYIARSDRDLAWLDRPPVPGQYGMAAFIRSIDTILWGRTTWDEAIARGMGGEGFGRGLRNFVFTHRPAPAPAPATEYVREDVGTFCRRLRATPGKHVWMMGGAGVIGSFLDAGEIDEFMIHVVPTFIGEGIPLVAPRHRTVPLRLLGTESYPDGVVRLHYAVERQAAAPARARPRARASKPRSRRGDAGRPEGRGRDSAPRARRGGTGGGRR